MRERKKREVKIVLRNHMAGKTDEYKGTSVKTAPRVWKTQINMDDRPTYGYAQGLHIITDERGEIDYNRTHADWFPYGKNNCDPNAKDRDIKPENLIEVTLNKEKPSKTIDNIIHCGVTDTVGGISLSGIQLSKSLWVAITATAGSAHLYDTPKEKTPKVVVDQFENKVTVSLENPDSLGTDEKIKILIRPGKKDWTKPP